MNIPIEISLTSPTKASTPAPKVMIVAGLPGVGKTRWIQEQIQQRLGNRELDPAGAIVYLNLGQGAVPIDTMYLGAEVPELAILAEEQLSKFIYQLTQQAPIQDTLYLELGFLIDPASLVLPLDESLCQRVVIISPGTNHREWQDWADAIVPGSPISGYQDQQFQISRSVLTGQVIDLSSLETFWYELSHGAYGYVQRAKGIFTPVDGRILHFDFVAGLPQTIATELPLPSCTKGRPKQFSGIEIVGLDIDQTGIAQTLGDCCLDDQAIAYYQDQIQAQLKQMS